MARLKLNEEKKAKLLGQIKREREAAKFFLNPRIETWIKRLKLYNNQKRDVDAIGDPLLFTNMNSLLAAYVDDQMVVKWRAREEGDKEAAHLLNLLCAYDYDLMGKEKIDYFQMWDALFFGYGVVELSYFDLEKKIGVPRLVDPMTFLYDPKCEWTDNMRFSGEEIYMTTRELNDKSRRFTEPDKVKTSFTSTDLPNMASQARHLAQGTENVDNKEGDFGDNTLNKVLVWKTWFDGKRIKAMIANEGNHLLSCETIDGDGWGYSVKEPFPQSHQFAGVSVGDLTEDKQRARSILQNISLKAIQSDLFGRFVYDNLTIKNKAELTQWGINQYIGVPSNNPAAAISPIHKPNPNVYLLQTMMASMDSAVQRALATPEIQQGVPSSVERSVSETNLVASKSDTRYGLTSKTLMWGEKEFWKQYYFMLKQNFNDEISEKIVRVAGINEDTWRKVRGTDLKTMEDLDVDIVSRNIEEGKNAKEMGRFLQVMNTLASIADADLKPGVKHLFSLAGIDEGVKKQMFPLTLDEMIAKRENEMLNLNRLPVISETDNHREHIKVHGEANQTDATFAHVEAHKKTLLLAKSMATQEGAAPDLTQQGIPTPQTPPQREAGADSRIPLVDSDTVKTLNPGGMNSSPTQLAKLGNRLK